jgi:putative redox protein
MKVELKQVQGNTYVGKGESNHWVPVDASVNSDGSAAGTGPMELVLIGLAGCTAMDVESILKKKRADMRKLDLEVTAERAAEHPKVFTEIHIVYIIHGDVKQADAEHAVSLSHEKYCSVAGSLKAKITHEIRIEK